MTDLSWTTSCAEPLSDHISSPHCGQVRVSAPSIRCATCEQAGQKVQRASCRRIGADAAKALPPADIYILPSLRLVDLSFAGRLSSGNEILKAIGDAQVGDRLTLVERSGKWELLDAYDRLLGRMATAWKPPPGHVFDGGQVGAIVNWRRIDNKEEFQGSLRRESWETVLPEMVFRPLDQAARAPMITEKTTSAAIGPRVDPQATPPLALDDESVDETPENLAAVKEAILEALSGAENWSALIAAVEAKGLTLAPKGGGLVVVDTTTGNTICKLSKLGFRYIRLIRRFGEGFPGHPATWLIEHALTGGNEAKVTKRPSRSRRQRRSSTGGDDLTVIKD